MFGIYDKQDLIFNIEELYKIYFIYQTYIEQF